MIKKKLISWTKGLINKTFSIVKTRSIPSLDNTTLTFANKGMQFEATTLFIDMRNSTKLLKKHNKTTIAKLYSVFFANIVLLAKTNNGSVRSFNGDGALIFFESSRFDSYNNAVKTAMEIKYILANENSEVKTTINKFTEIDFGIGIAHGEILCTKVGIGGDGHNKDLVWIGNAVNKSSKLADIARSPHNIIISESVYNNLKDENKYLGFNNKLAFGIPMIKIDMWEMRLFEYNGSNKNVYITSHSLEP